MTVTEWEPIPPTEPPRDHWGRPKVIPPDGGKPKPYTRCTTYVGCLEDTYNLSQWQKRMVAVGLSQRPDLLLRVSSLGSQPDDDQQVKRWKDDLNTVCEAATEAAQASASATIGTSLHALTERLDRGADIGVVPEQYRPHLDAYASKTADFTALHIERFTVHDQLQIGGTPDRVLKVPGQDKLIIGDIKTGNVTYGVGKMAMQLAVYAHSMLYDPMTGQRSPLGDVDTEHGLIIALDAATGKCDLIQIDLAAGWRAVELATDVRKWRKSSTAKNLTNPWPDPVTPATPVSTPKLGPDVSLVKAIQQAGTADELIALWRAAGDRWTERHTEMAAERKHQL